MDDYDRLSMLQDDLVWYATRHGRIQRETWNSVSYGVAPDYDTVAQQIRHDLQRVVTTPTHRPSPADIDAVAGDAATIARWIEGVEARLGVTPLPRKTFAPLRSPTKSAFQSFFRDLEKSPDKLESLLLYFMVGVLALAVITIFKR